MIRRQRIDLELLLIIRRAERQARLLGGSPFNQPDAVIIVRSTERVTLTDLPVAQERASAACANSADEDSRIARPGLNNVYSTGPMPGPRQSQNRGFDLR